MNFSCAQGRCATRLRYAPTHPIINDGVDGKCFRLRNRVIFRSHDDPPVRSLRGSLTL